MSKFLTEAKKASLEESEGKQVDSHLVVELTFSDLVQRGIVAKSWGFSDEEIEALIKKGIKAWKKYMKAQRGED